MVNKKRDTFRLTVSHFKILETIYELNKVNKYPSAKGVNNILSGKIDEETRNYSNISTYGTLISFPGRRLCSFILNMVRRGYVNYMYDQKTDDSYLRVTEKGETELFLFNKKHKEEFKKKNKKIKLEIVEIK